MDEFDRDCWLADRKWWTFERERRLTAEVRVRELTDLLRLVVAENGAYGNLLGLARARAYLYTKETKVRGLKLPNPPECGGEGI